MTNKIKNIGEAVALILSRKLDNNKLRISTELITQTAHNDYAGAGFKQINPYLQLTVKKRLTTYLKVFIMFEPDTTEADRILVELGKGISNYVFSRWILEKLTIIFNELKKDSALQSYLKNARVQFRD